MVQVVRAMRTCIFMSRKYSRTRLYCFNSADTCRGPDPAEVQKAKELCLDLLENVKAQYEEFKNRPPPQRGYGQTGGYGGDRGYGDRGPDRGSTGGYGGYANSPNTPSGIMSPTTPSAPGATTTTAGSDYAAQYAQYYGAGADPYAAYGGYQAYVAYYQQYMAAMAASGQQQSPPGAPSTAPPPPPSEAPPPPPSGGPPGTGGYNAVSYTSNGEMSMSNFPQVPPPPGM